MGENCRKIVETLEEHGRTQKLQVQSIFSSKMGQSGNFGPTFVKIYDKNYEQNLKKLSFRYCRAPIQSFKLKIEYLV